MRKPVIAGNWKLFKTKDEALALIGELAPLVAGVTNVEIVVAPVFTVLPSLVGAVAGTPINLAAQDVFWEEEGAFTGEVSPKMLLDAGASHVIIGHSERREYFGETDATVNKKIRAALKGRVLYGGSVKPENVKGLMSCPDIDGALVGGASLKGASFAAIVNFNE